MKKALLITLSIMLIFVGIGIGTAISKPAVIYKEVPVVKEVVHYVDVPPIIEIIEVPVEVVVEIEVPKEVRLFETIEEFEAWRDDRLLITINGKQYLVPTKTYSPKNDCDDVAETWQRWAYEDGYLASQQAVWRGKVCGIKVSQTLGKHMGLMIIIGNEVFFQDTYPPYKLIKFANRD